VLDARPDVLAALRAEQASVVAAHGHALTPPALAAMPYADAVVREVARAWPVVNGVFRKALVDLEVSGARVPAGWALLVMISGPTKASLVGAGGADEFDPGRWLDAGARAAGSAAPGCPRAVQSLVRDPPGFLPFGLGPHVCLGMGLALAELRAVVAVLVREYDWSTERPGEEWRPPLPPADGLPVRFWRRADALSPAAE
jgi:cytochrome P450